MTQIHSNFGGSSIYILDKCAGALRQYKSAPQEQSSPQAEEGTAAHEMSEFAFNTGVSAYDCVGLTFNNHVVTDAMANDVQLYISDVRRILAENPGAVFKAEPRVVMSSVSQGVFGFVDALIFVPAARKLYIGDLKYGYGLVESSTMQLKHYLVSALDTFQLWGSVDTIEGIIYQPRGEHIDGEIRRVQYTIQDAVQFQQRFLEIYNTAMRIDAPLVAGEHCRYCKASPICRPRLLRTLDLLYPDAPMETLDPGEVMLMFKEVATMKRQADKIAELANQYGKGGKRLDGFKMVKSIARHECTDEDALVNEILSSPASSIKDKTELYNMRLKGKTALLDTAGVPRSVVNKYFKAPDNIGTELVPVSDRRPAIGVGSGIGRFDPVSGIAKPHNFSAIE